MSVLSRTKIVAQGDSNPFPTLPLFMAPISRSVAGLLGMFALLAGGCRHGQTDTLPGAETPAAATHEPDRSPKIEKFTLASGLVIEDVIAGTGDMCLPDSIVRVRYTCMLAGDEVDASGDQSVELHLPRMIRGWQDGLPGMRVGGKRRLTVPPDLGYGSRSVKDAQGAEVIPPGSVLVYEIDLLGLVTSPADAAVSGG